MLLYQRVACPLFGLLPELTEVDLPHRQQVVLVQSKQFSFVLRYQADWFFVEFQHARFDLLFEVHDDELAVGCAHHQEVIGANLYDGGAVVLVENLRRIVRALFLESLLIPQNSQLVFFCLHDS